MLSLAKACLLIIGLQGRHFVVPCDCFLTWSNLNNRYDHYIDIQRSCWCFMMVATVCQRRRMYICSSHLLCFFLSSFVDIFLCSSNMACMAYALMDIWKGSKEIRLNAAAFETITTHDRLQMADRTWGYCPTQPACWPSDVRLLKRKTATGVWCLLSPHPHRDMADQAAAERWTAGQLQGETWRWLLCLHYVACCSNPVKVGGQGSDYTM